MQGCKISPCIGGSGAASSTVKKFCFAELGGGSNIQRSLLPQQGCSSVRFRGFRGFWTLLQVELGSSEYRRGWVLLEVVPFPSDPWRRRWLLAVVAGYSAALLGVPGEISLLDPLRYATGRKTLQDQRTRRATCNKGRAKESEMEGTFQIMESNPLPITLSTTMVASLCRPPSIKSLHLLRQTLLQPNSSYTIKKCLT